MTSSTGNVRWKALKEIDQVARESSRPKSCRLKPGHVVRNLSSVAQKKVKLPEEPYTKKIRISDCK